MPDRENVRIINADPGIGEQAAITTIPLPTGLPRQPIRTDDANPSAHLRTIKRALLGILFLFVLSICYVARGLIIPVILALLLSLLLSPVVTLLQRAHLPRAVGSILVLMGVVVTIASGAALLSQPARVWVANAPATIQSIQQKFRSFREPIQRAEEATKKLESLTQLSGKSTVVRTQTSLLTSMAISTPRVLTAIMVVVILVYFFLSSGNSFLRRMVDIAPGLTEKKVVVSIARDVQAAMSRYLLMVSMINIALGAVTALTMALLGVPDPLLWGAVAAVLNFVPYVGPTVTGIALLLVGVATFKTLGHAFAVPGAFVVIAVIEGQLITPTIIGRRLALDPVMVFVWLLLWGWLWGIPGVLLAGPLIACVSIVCQHVDALKSVGVLISDGSSSESSIMK